MNSVNLVRRHDNYKRAGMKRHRVHAPASDQIEGSGQVLLLL